MRNSIKVALVLLALSAFQVARAADTWHTSEIKSLYPLSDGAFVIIFHQDSASCTSGTTGKYHYVEVGQNGVTVEGSKKIYAAAMLSIALGRAFSVVFDSASAACYISRAVIDN